MKVADRPTPRGWEEVRHTLRKTFSFDSGAEARRFIDQAEERAKETGHDPHALEHGDGDTVFVELQTHTPTRHVSDKDIELASWMNDAAREKKASLEDRIRSLGEPLTKSLLPL